MAMWLLQMGKDCEKVVDINIHLKNQLKRSTKYELVNVCMTQGRIVFHNTCGRVPLHVHLHTVLHISNRRIERNNQLLLQPTFTPTNSNQLKFCFVFKLFQTMLHAAYC